MKSATLDKVSCFLAELIGTALLIFLGCMGCVKNEYFPNNHLQLAFNFGLVVMIIIQSFGCVSGAHLNPAVTLAALIYEMISVPMALIYMIAQMLGGFIGYGLLMLVLPETALKVPGADHGLCVTTVHSELNKLQGVGCEFIVTAVLILVCCGVWDPRNSKYHDSTALRFGLAISCLALTGGPFTGASMNPARSFGPALWNYDFEDHWVYWVAPLSAAAITAFAYKIIFRRNVIDTVRRSKDDVALG